MTTPCPTCGSQITVGELLAVESVVATHAPAQTREKLADALARERAAAARRDPIEVVA